MKQMPPEIVVHEDAQDNGLGSMIADLLRDNLAASDYKTKVFSLMKGVVTIEATDAEVITTLIFDRGRCIVRGGEPYPPDLRVVTDSESILGLSLVRLVWGLPWFFDEQGRGVVKKMLNGEVVLDGAHRHPLLLNLLTIVLSVS
jgi:hypothetical protein